MSMTQEDVTETAEQKHVNDESEEIQTLQHDGEETEEKPNESEWGPTAVEV